MGTKVQSKTYFPGSTTDLNNGFCNGVWDLYHDDKNHKISGPGPTQHYDYFLMREAMDGYTGYAKEQIRQTILKQESIFRHQLQELHRLYKRQKDLMNLVPAETHVFASSFPLAGSTSGTDNIFSRLDSIKRKNISNGFGHFISKCNDSKRRLIDLKLPADIDESNKESLMTKSVFNLADLNEPIHTEETDFSASVRDLSAKRTIFGVEICEKNQNPSFDSLQTPNLHSSNPQSSFVLPWPKISSSCQNASTLENNHWLSSSDSSRKIPEFFTGNKLVSNGNSRHDFVNGINLKNSVSDNLEEFCSIEKHNTTDIKKNHETRLPPWLTAKPCEQIKGKQTTLYQMNLDSLQNHSQQFFKKDEITEFKKVKNDDFLSITKILGVPITDMHKNSKDLGEENGGNNCVLEMKHQIDLNLSLDEEEDPATTPSFPESIIKIASMEIDLEAPALLESEPDLQEMCLDDDSKDTHVEIIKVAAEAIMSISKSELDASQAPQEPPPAATLLWFADVIFDDESVPEGMDDFEYMTLKLQDNKEYDFNYKPMILEEKEDDAATLSKRKGRRGRQKKDFQKDILPSIVSLSRREVTEDLQIFEDALTATGVTWQSSLSKRKAAGKNGRARRRLVAAETSGDPLPPPEVAVEESICRGLGGWGRRTRRLPRQRCQNSGNHCSLALKC